MRINSILLLYPYITDESDQAKTVLCNPSQFFVKSVTEISNIS